MKLTNYMLVATAALAVASCSKWTEPERKTFPGQGNIERIIPEPPAKPLIDIKTEAELNNTQREYFKKIREYRTTPHVLGFGWYGNWTGQGTDPMRHLKTLPDSVDFVSLWGTRTPLTESQKLDLKFFQDVKGGKALLCWIVQDLGGPLTPTDYKGREHEYWFNVKGGGDLKKAAIAYAEALCDTIEKYNLDGFDIDYEPGYGHSGSLANHQMISETSGNTAMYAFIKTMYDRFKPKGRMLVFDGEPEYLSTEASKMIDFYIYQAYWETSAGAVKSKVNHTHLDKWDEKTIITAEYEQTWRDGNGRGYSAADADVRAMQGGRQITDYAVLDLNGKRVAGIGTYHMEYDKSDEIPYRWLRQALDFGNKTKPGKFTGKLPAPAKKN